MNFKDQLKKDLKVFINPTEFGEEANIDGQKINVVIDNDRLTELKLKNNGEGLANSELLFHVEKSALSFAPKVGQDLTFNDDFYYISNVQENEEMFTIVLEVPVG